MPGPSSSSAEGAGSFGTVPCFNRLRSGAVEVILRQAFLQDAKRFLRRIGKLKEIEVLGRDRALLDQHVHVDDLLPVARPVDDDRDLLRELVRLVQRQQLEHLIQRSEAARKDHQRLREIRKPVLAHEEVVEVEVERRRDVRVRVLLERQLDIEPDRLAAGLPRAAVGGLHDARAAARGHDKPVPSPGQTLRPLRHHARQLARVLVVVRHLDRGLRAVALQLRSLAALKLLFICRLLSLRRRWLRSLFVQQLQLMIRDIQSAKRAEPKNTTVSWMRSRRNLAIGSVYSARMRSERPSGESRKAAFS